MIAKIEDQNLTGLGRIASFHSLLHEWKRPDLFRDPAKV
jgi:hypothetical protein